MTRRLPMFIIMSSKRVWINYLFEVKYSCQRSAALLPCPQNWDTVSAAFFFSAYGLWVACLHQHTVVKSVLNISKYLAQQTHKTLIDAYLTCFNSAIFIDLISNSLALRLKMTPWFSWMGVEHTSSHTETKLWESTSGTHSSSACRSSEDVRMHQQRYILSRVSRLVFTTA